MSLVDVGWLVLFVVVPFACVYGLGRLSRWYAGRHDPIDELITTPKWCKDGAGWMNTVDKQKVERAGEVRWQETLRAQRKTRKRPAAPKPHRNVIQMKRRA